MKKLSKVINDKQIIDIYNQIYKFEEINKARAHHDFNHVINVSLLIEKLLNSLNYDFDVIEEAKIAAILHDTGCLYGKDGHADRSYEFAKQYIKENNVELKYKEQVLEAIKNHSSGFKTDNVITLVLILADKLDIKYTRVAKAGLHVEGMKEMQYIRDILVNIEKDILQIEFICDFKINIKRLEEYYFMEKVFKSIKAFARKMNLHPKVLVNGKEWKAFYKVNI